MSMVNNYGLADQIIGAANALLSQMDIDKGERASLVRTINDAFKGEGGQANTNFQAEFARRVDAYDQALLDLKNTINSEVGTGGSMHIADKGNSAMFDGILGF
ncbi:hypothetical protein [Nocardia cyriacigeorgica]|jgi:uncharacterized protein YukE|uniref:hypothetical protein n=1 Tax=Nocardia cyriacigeorgica TaxID=135487 RepID=UPI00131A2E91|nr:hypothetical protein [Nocardia cyriacigeorgica]